MQDGRSGSAIFNFSHRQISTPKFFASVVMAYDAIRSEIRINSLRIHRRSGRGGVARLVGLLNLVRVHGLAPQLLSSFRIEVNGSQFLVAKSGQKIQSSQRTGDEWPGPEFAFQTRPFCWLNVMGGSAFSRTPCPFGPRNWVHAAAKAGEEAQLSRATALANQKHWNPTVGHKEWFLILILAQKKSWTLD